MSTSAEELERMVIRLIGDASHYIKELDKVKDATKMMAQDVKDHMNNVQASQKAVEKGIEYNRNLAANSMKMETRNAEAAAKSLEGQKQKAYEGDLKAIEAAKKSLESQKQKAYEKDLKDKESAFNKEIAQNYKAEEAAAKKLDAQKQKAYEKSLKDKEAAFNKDVAQNYKSDEAAKKAGSANRQKLLDDQVDRQRKLDKALQSQEQKGNRDRRTIAFNEMKERQRLLDQKISDEQKRFEKSNKLALQTDRQRERDRVQAEKEADRAKKQKEQQTKTDNRKAAQDSVRLGEQITATVKGVAFAAGAIAAPIGYVGKVSVEEYAKFNQALTESTSMMKVTEGQTEAVSESVLNLSKTSKFGPAELASAFRLLAGSGLDAEQSIKALPIVTTFATAANIDLGKAIESAAQAQTVMGLNSEDTTTRLTNLTRVTDVLTEASRLSGKEANVFASALTHDAGAAAHSMGKSIEETTALMVAFSRQGISGEMAGAYASKFTRFAADRSVQNQQVFKDLGVNVFDKDTGKMRNYADILDDMGQAFKGLSDQGRTAVLRMMGFEPRTQSAMMAVMNASDKVREFQKDLEGAGGTAQSVADKQLASFNNQMQMMKNSVTVVLIGIGKQLAPALLVAAKVVQFFTDAWEALPSMVKSTVVVFGLVIGAIAALVAGAIGAWVAFNFVFGGIPLLILAAIAAVTLFIGVIAGIGAAVFQQAGGFEMLKRKALEMWEWLAPVRFKVELFFITLYRVGSRMIKDLTDFISAKFEAMSKSIDWDRVLNGLTNTVDFARFTLMNLETVWDYLWLKIKYSTVSSLNYILNNLFIFAPAVAVLFHKLMSGIMTLTLNALNSLGINWKQYFLNIYYGIGFQWAKMDWSLFKAKELQGIELDFSGIKVKGLAELENKLKGEMDEAKKVMDDKFDKWKKANQTEILDIMPDVEEMAAPIKKAGEEDGKQFVQGIDKGIKQNQSALTGSAEFLSRVLAYRDTYREPDESLHNKKKTLSPLSGTAAGNKAWQDQLDLLQKIKENGDNLLKKDPVKVENANLAG